jgi:hypothetical protein
MKDQGNTITGLALNGKRGALIKTSEGEVFYIEGLSAWTSDINSKRVMVTGNLITETVTEEELKNEQGEWKQGIAGKINVIQNAKWTILKSNE